MATATEEARRKVIDARASLGDDLDEFSSAARSAVDIPAKIKKNPLKTVALATGVGFLGVGGPRRVLKAAGSKIRPRTRRPHEGLLPKEIDHAIKKKAGPNSPEIQEALEDDFARYLKNKAKADAQEPTAARSLLRTYDTLVGPLGAVLAKQLAEKLVEADPNRPRGDDDSAGATEGAKPAGGGLSALSGLGDSIRKRTQKESGPVSSSKTDGPAGSAGEGSADPAGSAGPTASAGTAKSAGPAGSTGASGTGT